MLSIRSVHCGNGTESDQSFSFAKIAIYAYTGGNPNGLIASYRARDSRQSQKEVYGRQMQIRII